MEDVGEDRFLRFHIPQKELYLLQPVLFGKLNYVFRLVILKFVSGKLMA